MKIIITGGAGYIGSHTAIEALRAGHEVIIIDSFINSSRSVLPMIEKASGASLIAIDLCMTRNPLEILEAIHEVANGADALIHFAALKNSPESTQVPLGYYRNNIDSLLSAIKISELLKIKSFVFSSSATVYGEPVELPIRETHPISKGTTPYGSSKVIGEWILDDATKVSNLRSVALRYFNPAGADASGMIGELPLGKAANLVPIITQSAAGVYGQPMKVTGTDFPTTDGSAIRDYIHVTDLAKAHLVALEWLNTQNEHTFDVFNIGTGKGTSVIEMLDTFETQVEPGLITYEKADRRPGDPAEVWCDASKAKDILGWEASLSVLDILKSAWAWEQKVKDLDI
jgi:UDP-glucose 4-epimerase